MVFLLLALAACSGCNRDKPGTDAGPGAISAASATNSAPDGASASRDASDLAHPQTTAPGTTAAGKAAPAHVVLFRNVRVFDGTGHALSAPSNVLVRGNLIAQISTSAIDVQPGPDVTVIDGGGRTLMPGLIDAHWHMMMAAIPMSALLTADAGYINLVAAHEANDVLMRGFTSVRDMSGPVFGLKRAIDQGLVPGPRIWPSGAMISQSGGHADFRYPYEVPQTTGDPLTHADQMGFGAIADGVDEVLRRTREQLMLGATQIKLAAGGGVASSYDPIDVTEYTADEFKAAVSAADNWGTYVAVHAYTPKAIQTAIESGVKCIEHGQLMDDATAKMMADKGIWLSTQPFLDNEFSNPMATPLAAAKQQEVYAGTDNAYRLARKYKLKTAWGTDILFDPKTAAKQGGILATMVRWYTPPEVLAMATGTNAQLLAMSGPRNPYPGKLGVVEQGALADLLLVDGDPTTDIDLVADAARNFVVIMKDGKIYKDTVTHEGK
jgi:imidazolonepropionase-like amidohydrolase